MSEDAAKALCSHQVLISQSRYDELKEAERKLTALKNAGVDNWDGYDFAMEGVWDGQGS